MNPRKILEQDVRDDITVTDEVNHPEHYQSGGLETIDVISAFTQDCTPIEAFCIGNALKYLCRWKKKNGIEDLRKAQWYINYLIRNRR